MKLKHMLFSILFLLICYSCTDLSLSPPSSASTGNWYQTEKQIKISVNDLFRQAFWPRDHPLWTDDFTWRTNVSAITSGTINPETNFVENIWSLKYKGIARANTIIENIKEGKAKGVSQEILDRYIAIARFVRACHYSYLINHWGNIPYYTSSLSLEASFNLTRMDKDAILDSIYKNFDKAIANLPVKYSGGLQYATKGAALAMKARVALYQGDWATARDAAKVVMELGVYKLYPDYGKLFKSTTTNVKEMIFVIPTNEQLGSSYPNPSTSILGYIPRIAGGYLNAYPSWQLVSSYLCTDGKPIDESPLYNPRKPFENRDPRLTETVVRFGTPWLGYVYQPHPDSLKTLNVKTGEYVENLDTRSVEQYTSYNGFAWKKGINKEWLDGAADNDIIIMRYADILLMYAEAKIELNDIDQSVLDVINKVRARAYKVNYTNYSAYPEVTTMNQKELRQIVRTERRMEFPLEGRRYMDLIRWGIADKALSTPVYGMLNPEKLRKRVVDKGLWFFPSTPEIDEDGIADFTPMYNAGLIRILAQRNFDASKQYLWPIPSTEIQINPNLKQNPGY